MALPDPCEISEPSAPPLGWVETPAYLAVADLIRQRGAPITFREFMQTALYGNSGYYTSSRDRRADYLTSPQTHSEFGACIARCLQRMWTTIGKPDEFSVLELGSGDGALSRQVSNEIERASEQGYPDARDFQAAVSYHCHDVQHDRPHERNTWPAHSERRTVEGTFHCTLSNELLDAFPVHRYIVRNSELQEIAVDLGSDGRLHETSRPNSANSVAPNLGRPISDYPDGYILEYSPHERNWANQVHQLVPSGYILTIDYGHPRNVLYSPDRIGGTLRSYQDHVLGANPFRNVGEQDLTSHVDFTLVDESLAQFNFTPSTPLMSQSDFLYCYGYGQAVMNARRKLVQAHDAEASIPLQSDLASLMALSDPRGLGRFKVAIHGRNVPPMPHDTGGHTDED